MLAPTTLGNYHSGPWFDRHGVLHFASTGPDRMTTEHRLLPAGTDLALGASQADPLIEPWRNLEPVRYVWGGTPSPDGHLMLLDVSDLDAKKDRGPSDLWIVQRTDTGWTEPRKLPPSIKSADQYENFVAFTPDGKTVVFVREFATYNEVSVGDLLRDP